MGSEVFLYAYGLVCLSMLVFNIVYSLHLRSSDRRLRRQVRGIAARAEVQMDRIRQGLPVEMRHRSHMARRLSRAAGLLAFDHYLDELDSNDPVFQEYLHQMRPVLLRLAIVYQKREDTQAAYFCQYIHRVFRVRRIDLYCLPDGFHLAVQAFRGKTRASSGHFLRIAVQEH